MQLSSTTIHSAAGRPGGRDGGRFLTLDGFRGVAALTVMAHHYSLYFFGGSGFGEGFLAVDLFYLLSGFVLAEAYSKRLDLGLSTPSFLRIRLVRLYPVLGLAMLLSAGALLCSRFFFAENMAVLNRPMDVWGSFAANLMFLPSPFFNFGEPFPWIRPAWSLSRPWLGTIGLGLVVGIAGAFLLCLGAGAGLDRGYHWSRGDFETGFCRVVYSFGLGLMFSRMRRVSVPKVRARYLLFPVFLVLCLEVPPPFEHAYEVVAVLAVFPACVLLAAANEPSSRYGAALCGVLGESSYCVYLLHWPALDFFILANRRLHLQRSVVSGIALMVFVLLLSILVNRAYDRPVRRWLGA
jgi:peptidoglycan/LPS O-acetylase OafA/YrhL